MLRLGNRAHATALHSRGKKLTAIELHRMSSRYNFILLLAQSETERPAPLQLLGADLVDRENSTIPD